jgi:Fe-S cluster assembly protein SufD
MSTAIAKTRAEEQLGEHFRAAEARLPGGERARAIRRAAFGRFGAQGLPHRRLEAWKYTDLRTQLAVAEPPAAGAEASAAALAGALAPFAELDAIRLVFVGGIFAPHLSQAKSLPGEVAFERLATGLAGTGVAWVEGRLAEAEGIKAGAVVSLNTAFASDGAIVRITSGARLARPLHLVFLAAGRTAQSVAVRNLIEVGAGAGATILESHVSLEPAGHQSNAASEVAIGPGARVRHVKHLASGSASAHLGTWIASVGAEAEYRAFQFTAGTGLVRNDISVTFAGAGARLDLSGAFLGRGRDHIDTTLVVDHAVPGCESRELFKGVLDGRARGVFQGKVIVRPDAQKSDGKQMAQALMLSPEAEFDSKPELEIYADDVVCGHGSTAAELDAGLVFYCRSRGIPEAEARALLTESFVGEAIEKVEEGPVREALMAAARRWLAGG